MTEVNRNPIIVDDFSTPIDRSCAQKTAEEPQNSMMFYSQSNRYLQTPNNIHCTQQHMKASLKQTTCWSIEEPYKNRNIEIMSYILSDHWVVQLEIDSKQISSKYKLTEIEDLITE